MFDFLPWLLVIAVLGIVWWQALGARTRARRAAIAACEQAGLIFIDELAFEHLRLRRGGLRRRYRFECYHRGDRRYDGHVDMHGLRVVDVHLDAHPFQPEPDDHSLEPERTRLDSLAAARERRNR